MARGINAHAHSYEAKNWSGGEELDIYEDRQDLVVHIRRRNNPTGPSGIYRCVIPTNAVHNDIDPSVGETVYVGLYANGGGT